METNVSGNWLPLLSKMEPAECLQMAVEATVQGQIWSIRPWLCLDISCERINTGLLRAQYPQLSYPLTPARHMHFSLEFSPTH